LARDILSPDDNLTRALGAITEDEKNSPTIKNLVNGLQMVQKEFSNILEKHGIKKIKALNEKFDHNFHQAMLEVEDDNADSGLVIQEIQSGYTMHDRLLRPSMVGVSKKSTVDKKTKE
jgi:molecular chaperone GrpE